MKTALLFAFASLFSLAPAAAGEGHGAGGHKEGHKRRDPEQRWQRLLERADTDHDGKISRAEFSVKGGGRFERLDRDGDGTITIAEVDAIERPRAKEHARKWLERMDASHDGSVTREEVKAGRAKHFDRIDVNHDGFVAKEEMQSAHRGAHADGGAGGDEERGGGDI